MEGYPHRSLITTRWQDNDVYGHVNNVEYYSFFDTVINDYLIAEGGLDIAAGPVIGLCAESHCSFEGPLAFPRRVEAGLRVAHLGRSSVRYEIGLRHEGEEALAATGLVRARVRGPRDAAAGGDAGPAARRTGGAAGVTVPELLARRRETGSRDDGARIALAIEGGGMRGAVSAGMAIALDELGLTEAFDAVYGASAGALNAVWLLSGNPSDGLRPYADPALIRQYIRKSNALRRRPVVDTRHLVEHLYEEVLPLRFERVLDASREASTRSPPTSRRAPPSTSAPTLSDRASLKRALRATTALPLLAGPPVEIDGRRYLDAGLAESIPFHAALAAGATHVLVLRSRRPQDAEKPSRVSRAVVGTMLARLGEPVRARLPRAPGAAGGRRRAARRRRRGAVLDPPAGRLAARVAAGVRPRRGSRGARGGPAGGARGAGVARRGRAAAATTGPRPGDDAARRARRARSRAARRRPAPRPRPRCARRCRRRTRGRGAPAGRARAITVRISAFLTPWPTPPTR